MSSVSNCPEPTNDPSQNADGKGNNMEFAEILGENSPLGFVIQWIILTVMFFMLTYLFRNKVEVEGMVGYFLLLAIVIPVNISAKNYIGYLEWPQDPQMAPVAYGMIILILNLVLLSAMTFVLPGITVSDNFILVFFAILFSAASVLLAFLPSMFQIGVVTIE